MNLNLHIERIVVDGVPLGPARRDQLRVALEAELAQRLQDRGLAPGLDGGIAVPELRAAPTCFDSLAPTHLAAQVAESVAATLAPPLPSASSPPPSSPPGAPRSGSGR